MKEVNVSTATVDIEDVRNFRCVVNFWTLKASAIYFNTGDLLNTKFSSEEPKAVSNNNIN